MLGNDISYVTLRQSSGYNDISFDIKRYDPNLPSLYVDNEQTS